MARANIIPVRQAEHMPNHTLLPSNNPRSSNTKTIPTKPRKTKRVTAHDKYSFRNIAPNKAAKNDDEESREVTVVMGKCDSPKFTVMLPHMTDIRFRRDNMIAFTTPKGTKKHMETTEHNTKPPEKVRQEAEAKRAETLKHWSKKPLP
jgi:hypothetical protein